MKTLQILGATAAILVGSLGLASTAQAYDGCGWGYHMNRWGECRPNYRPYRAYGYYTPRPVVFYGGGWGHRHHHHGGFGFGGGHFGHHHHHHH